MAKFKFSAGVAAACLAAVALAGCDDKVIRGAVDFEKYTAKQIFERAEHDLANGNPAQATKVFAEVERLYPYSDWAKRSVIMQAYASHLARDYDGSRLAAGRFIDFYPADSDAAYAQYILALSFYDQIDEVGRDQGLAEQALRELRTVYERYPESDYARPARLKYDLAFDHLAGKEMEIGRYYLRRDHFAAAINRFRNVVQNYQTSTHTAEALHRLVEAYLALGFVEEARTTGAILGHNFRGTQWYDDSYRLLTREGHTPEPIGDSWPTQIYRQIIRGEWL